MRTAFQLLVFAAYMGALIWGGWYIFSGQMIADRETAAPVELSDVVNEITADTAGTDTGNTDEDNQSPEQP